jgi:hypothetical protein
VLGYKVVASHDLGLGRLVAPFGPEIPVPGRSYFFVCPKGEEKRPAIKAFRDWVFAEIEQTSALLEQVTQRPGETCSRKAPIPLAARPAATLTPIFVWNLLPEPGVREKVLMRVLGEGKRCTP